MIRIALYQPDIPQNTGTLLRFGACLNVPVDIIGPAGFALSDKAFRRAGMDYLDRAAMTTHISWSAFCDDPTVRQSRLVLLTTKSDIAYTSFTFRKNDILLLGRESAGVPDSVHETVAERVTIPMQNGARSLNIALAAAMVTGEALRQVAIEQ